MLLTETHVASLDDSECAPNSLAINFRAHKEVRCALRGAFQLVGCLSSAKSWIINQLTCYRSIIVRVWHMKRAAELHQRGGASPNVFDWNARIVWGLLTQPQVMIYWRRTHRWWAAKQLNYLIMDMSEDLLHYWSVWFVLTIHICVLRSNEANIQILYTR